MKATKLLKTKRGCRESKKRLIYWLKVAATLWHEVSNLILKGDLWESLKIPLGPRKCVFSCENKFAFDVSKYVLCNDWIPLWDVFWNVEYSQKIKQTKSTPDDILSHFFHSKVFAQLFWHLKLVGIFFCRRNLVKKLLEIYWLNWLVVF